MDRNPVACSARNTCCHITSRGEQSKERSGRCFIDGINRYDIVVWSHRGC